MAVKTLTFKFIKKTKFKFDKENFVNKSGKKKILGLQAMSFSADESYHIAPVKISKNELQVTQKGKDIEIEGLLKFKVNVKDQLSSKFSDYVKNKKIIIRLFGFNTDPTPGIEITMFEFPNPNKTNDYVEIT